MLAMGAGGLDVAVAMGGGAYYITMPKVVKDNVKAGRDAVNYLIRKGHKKIGLITTLQRSQSSIDREIGYKLALKDNG
ncbi:hypothetical protein OSL57_27700, partial [Escherichia coli]|nr:hypothetical protein [Escherichia coli]